MSLFVASVSRSAWPGVVPSPLVSHSSTGNTAVARGSLAGAAAHRGTIATKDAIGINTATFRIRWTPAQKRRALEKTKDFHPMKGTGSKSASYDCWREALDAAAFRAASTRSQRVLKTVSQMPGDPKPSLKLTLLRR